MTWRMCIECGTWDVGRDRWKPGDEKRPIPRYRTVAAVRAYDTVRCDVRVVLVALHFVSSALQYSNRLCLPPCICFALLRVLLQAEANTNEAAQEASLEAAAKLEAKVEQLQVRYFLHIVTS